MRLIDADKLAMHVADCRLSESITWEEAELITDFLSNSKEVKLRLMRTEECAGHSIEYAAGWKACIEWIKNGGYGEFFDSKDAEADAKYGHYDTLQREDEARKDCDK